MTPRRAFGTLTPEPPTTWRKATAQRIRNLHPSKGRFCVVNIGDIACPVCGHHAFHRYDHPGPLFLLAATEELVLGSPAGVSPPGIRVTPLRCDHCGYLALFDLRVAQSPLES